MTWRRTAFEEIPELYDRARPTYPEEIFDDLATLAALPEGARIVEIGCGPGKATLPLARRGFRVTCVATRRAGPRERGGIPGRRGR